MKTPTIRIEVAYAQPGRLFLRTLHLAPGSTVGEALSACGVLAEYPEINLECNRVGIFGRFARLDTPLQDDDRVEIYRPLRADPKDARRRRAAAAKRRA